MKSCCLLLGTVHYKLSKYGTRQIFTAQGWRPYCVDCEENYDEETKPQPIKFGCWCDAHYRERFYKDEYADEIEENK